MKSKRSMPEYAVWNSVELTRYQFGKITKGRMPKAIAENYQNVIRIAQTNDGKFWAEWKGDTVFWASRWWEISKAAGKRAFELNGVIDEFLQSTRS